MMLAVATRSLRYAFASLLFCLSIPASVFASTPTWQGPYVGAYAGGAVGNNDLTSGAGRVTSSSYFTTSADINAVSNAGSWTKNSGTLIAGIQAGHDWIWKQAIYGVAIDYSALPLSSSSTTNSTYPDNASQYSVYTSIQTNWLFTLRGRLGYQTVLTLPSFVYLTGGIAATKLKVSNSFSDNSATAGASNNYTSQNQIGWTAGAGIEVAAFDHTSIDFEYLFISIPSVKTMSSISNTAAGFGIPPQSTRSPFSTTANFYANVFKIGLNYRFDE
jgi:outer membrane immunogenic protein